MWQVEKSTKRCQNCNLSIEVNKDYFSALFPAHQDATPETSNPHLTTSGKKESISVSLARQDFCADCWEKRNASGEEPPFSFWQTIIAPPSEPPKTPKQILLSFFDNLFGVDAPTETAVPDGTTSMRLAPLGVAGIEPEPASVLSPSPNNRLKDKVKYLFSLILLRKKLLRLKNSFHKDGIRFLLLERFSDDKRYEVPDIDISEQEIVALRDEFSNLFEFRI